MSTSAPNPNAVVNQGQLKHFTACAVQEMNNDLAAAGGAGTALNNLVSGWQQDYATNAYASNPNNPTRPYKPTDFDGVTVGQLKYIASLIYGRLHAVNYPGPYPTWIAPNPATDSTLAVIGQLKTVFNFDLNAVLDPDGSGLPVAWEELYFGHLGVDPSALAPNGSGLTILQAYQQGVNPVGAPGAMPPVLRLVSGNGQSGAAGALLGQPLVVKVLDTSAAPITNAQVTFQVSADGGGGLAAVGSTAGYAGSLTVPTDANGIAEARLQLVSNPVGHCVVSVGSRRPSGSTVPSNSVQFIATIVNNAHAPAAPTGLQYSVLTDGSVHLVWQDDAGDATGFAIERKVSGSGWANIGSTAANVTAFTDASPTGQPCFYRIVAANAQGETDSDPIFCGQGPAVAITSPTEGMQTLAHGHVILNASASNATVPIVKVEFFDGVVKLGESDSVPYSFTWTNVLAGTHSIHAVATDATGASTVSESVNIATTSFPYIAAGGDQSYSLQNDGTLWAWGSNAQGQLGTGSTTPRYYNVPVKIVGTAGTQSVASASSYTLILNANGTVDAFGGNDYGQLGDGDTFDRPTPASVSGLTNVTAIAASSASGIALKADGTVWTWGGSNRSMPVQVEGLNQVTAIAAGDTHFLALTSQHTVWAWGNNTQGQLGTGNTTDQESPTLIPGLTGVISIAAGSSHSVALDTQGVVYTWGANSSGQLGNGSTGNSLAPAPINNLNNITAIATKGSHTLALTATGAVWAFGANTYGQIGDGTLQNRLSPVQVMGLPMIVQIATGASHSLALTQDGTILSWGDNVVGQLGDDTIQTWYSGSPRTVGSVYSGNGNGATVSSTAGQGTPNPGGGGTGPKLDADPGAPPQITGIDCPDQIADSLVTPSVVKDTDYTKPRIAWTCTYTKGIALTGFKIQRRVGTGEWDQVATTGPSEFTYKDSGVFASQTYNYRVLAVYGAFVSRPSNMAIYEAPLIVGIDGRHTSISYTKPGFAPFDPQDYDYSFIKDSPEKRYLVSTQDNAFKYDYEEFYTPNLFDSTYSISDPDSAKSTTTITPTYLPKTGTIQDYTYVGSGESDMDSGNNTYDTETITKETDTEYSNGSWMTIEHYDDYTDGTLNSSGDTTTDPSSSPTALDHTTLGSDWTLTLQDYAQDHIRMEGAIDWDTVYGSEHSTGHTYNDLSVEYSTQQFLQDLIPAGWDVYPARWSRIDNILVGVTVGSRNLAADELSFDASKFQYKFVVTPSVAHDLSWNVMFFPTPDLDSTDPLKRQPKPLFIETCHWQASNTGITDAYEIDPIQAGASDIIGLPRGTYATVAAPSFTLHTPNTDNSVSIPSSVPDSTTIVPDSSKNTTGGYVHAGQSWKDTFIEINSPDVYQGGNNNSLDFTYTLTWSGNNFKVYIADNTADDGRKEIFSGYQVNSSQLPLRVYVISDAYTANGDHLDLTLAATDSKGNDLGNDYAKITYVVPTDNLTTVDDASGAEFRKVALNGRPLADQKPQQKAETDEQREESYVDAMTLEMHHNTTDVYLPVPSSALTMSARRNITSEVWNLSDGLRPHERPDRPFGSAWTTNLCANVHTVSKLLGTNSSAPREPDYAYVTDENGSVYKFAIWYDEDGTHYLPMPTAKHEEQTYLVSFDGSTFRHKYGSTLNFADAKFQFVTNADRVRGGNDKISHTFQAVSSIVDRLGNRLDYEYDDKAISLVPKTITAVGRPNLTLYIRQDDNGLITSIWDANGNQTNYEYTHLDQDNVWTLSKVKAADGGETDYAYDYAVEDDQTPHAADELPVPKYHLDVKKITSPNNVANGMSTTIEYEFDHTKLDYKQDSSIPFDDYYVETGLPRTVTSISLPECSGATSFVNQSQVKLALVNGQAVLAGQRQTQVTDAAGYTRTYQFTDAQAYAMSNFKQLLDGLQVVNYSGHVYPCIVYYLTETIDQGVWGYEQYTFDLAAGLAIKRAQDLCGNLTTYTHDDVWPAPDDYRKIFPDAYNNFYVEPTSQTNAAGKAKVFTYDSSRLLQTITDEEGRKTVYDIDGSGRRKSETTYEPNGVQPAACTTWDYDDTFGGFVAKQTIHKLGVANDPTDWGGDLVTQYIPDSAGRIKDQIVDPSGQNLKTTYAYDHNGNKQSAQDARGHVTLFTYDHCNRLEYVTHPDSSQRHLVYDLNGNKIQEWDENGHATLYEYDDLNRLKRQARDMNRNQLIDPGIDLITSYTYNDVNSPVTVTDPNGNVTTTHYDALQRPYQIDHPLIGSTLLLYDVTKNCGGNVFDTSSFKPTQTTDPAGYVTNITYDALYRPQVSSRQYQSSPPLFAQTLTSFDDVGNLRFTTDARGHTTETRYDALNRPYYVGYADGNYIQNTYSSTGLKWQTQDESLQVTETRYDGAGRPTDVYAPAVYDSVSQQTASPHTQTIYDENGNITGVINPRGYESDFTFNARNRQTDDYGPSVYDADSGQSLRPHTHTEYDGVGNRISVTDPRGYTTQYEPDDANRVVRVTSPAVPLGGDPTAYAAPVTQTTYDLNGNVRTVTDANNHVTTNFYDALNRLWITVNPELDATQYGYDNLGNRTLISAGLKAGNLANGPPTLTPGSNPQTTTLSYDGLNRNTLTSYPSGAVSYTYDGVVKLSRQDGNSLVTNYDDYDNRNRIKQVNYPSSAADDRTYNYDANGRILSVTEAHGGVTDVAYTYDALGRTQTETSNGVTHTYLYDLAGNRTSKQYGTTGTGTGRLLLSNYDALNRLYTLADGTHTTTYQYDLGGHVRTKLLPDGETESISYDALGRQSDSSDLGGSGGLIYAYNYGYDAGGNLTLMSEYKAGMATRRTTMSYYPSDRLETESVYAGTDATAPLLTSTTYAYDEMGNRTSRQVAGGLLTSYSYNGTGQLDGFSKTTSDGNPSGHNVSFSYDGNGNRATRTEGTATDIYTYDPENELVGLSKGGQQYAYLYDYRTRRVQRTEGSTSTQVVFSGGTSVQEYPLGGTGTTPVPPNVEFIRGSDWGGGVGGILYSVHGGGSPSFDHYDGRGDVATQTDGLGTVTYQANYEAWGTRAYEFGSDGDRQRANTKEEDPTGLLNEGMRYRDLEAGCFTTRDPAGFVDGPNLYAYVNQNPWTKFDPEGLSAFSDLTDSAANDLAQDHYVFGYGKAALASVWEAFSFGAASHVGAVGDRYDAGEISAQQAVNAGTIEVARSLTQATLTYGGGEVLGAGKLFKGGTSLVGAALRGSVAGAGYAATSASVDIAADRGVASTEGDEYNGSLAGDAATVGKSAAVGAAVGAVLGPVFRSAAGTTPQYFSGTDKPWTKGATPHSIYTQIDPKSGKAVQNAIYDGNGDVSGHVDFKNHGPGALSGHGHIFPQPGNPASGHGPGKPHIPNGQLPQGWDTLPPGVQPHTPIGQ